MSKSPISNLNKLDLASSLIKRLKARSKAPDDSVKDLYSYAANKLAAELHPHVQNLIVTHIREHNNNVKTYTLSPDMSRGTDKIAWFSAGQYVSVALDINGAKLCRPYSISSSPADTLTDKMNITVKRVDGGLASEHILDNWTIGTKVTSSGPLGEFTYEPLRDADTVIGIAGGSGITPFMSMIKAITEDDEDFKLILLYGSRTLDDAIFSDDIISLSKTDDRIRLINVLSEEQNENCEYGFITSELIKKYAPSDSPYSVFLCGPQAMYDFVDKQIEDLSIERKYVRHELFGEYFHPEKNTDYNGNISDVFSLTIKIADKDYSVKCRADTSLLRSMEQACIPAPSDCRSGKCGWCRSRLISGQVYIPSEVDGRRLADKEYGYIHPCVSFPLSDLIIEVSPLPY